MQLVQRHPRPPARRQRGRLVVAGQDPVQVRRAEQGQHGQVGLPVPAVRGRVDQPAPPAGPQHVPRPAVAVDAARRLGRAGQLGDAGQHGLHRRHVCRAERARVGGPAQVGQQPPAGVPLRPGAGVPRAVPAGRGPVVRQRQAGDEPRPRRPEPVGTGRVQPGQVAPEPPGRVPRPASRAAARR